MSNEEIRRLPDEISPISMWGYFGYQILFAIPIVGFIILLVFALGGASNVNVRNYARSYFCVIIFAICLIGFLGMTGIGTAIFSQL